MTDTTLSASAARPLPLDKLFAGAAFLLALATISGAWVSELVFGLVPCDLCLEQRVAYYVGLPVLAIALILWNRLPLAVWYGLIAASAGIFVWSTYMGGYHAGVEWGFWPGPTACSGAAAPQLSFSDLSAGNVQRVVPCDEVQFRFLGISLAGYNALISAAVTTLLAAAMFIQARRRAG